MEVWRRAVAVGRRALASPWLRPLNDADAHDDLLALANPLWSVRAWRARVVRVIDETPDARTFVLRPNRRWGGFVAGQHVCVAIAIDGVRHERAYSLSSRPGEPTIAVPVQRQPGSGITPVRSILRDLHARRPATDVVLVHSCRTPQDAIFRRELVALARTWPALRLEFVFTAEAGRLDRTRLTRLVPDWAARTTFLCGPVAFMEMVREMWREAGAEGRLRSESFTGPAPAGNPAALATATVTCVRSGAVFAAAADRPLLVEAERSGLRPRHGCRMGICHTCLCRKVSGTVENLVTGAVSSAPNTMIQLCICAARSDLTLAL